MIVAYNALSLRPGITDGAATYSLNLLRHLPASLPDEAIVVFARANENRIAAAGNLSVRRVGVRGTRARLAFELFRLRKLLDEAGVDVLVSPNESLPFGLDCPAVVVAQNVVYHCDAPRDFTGSTLGRRAASFAQTTYYRRRMSGAYARAARVVAVSQFAADLLAARAGLDPAKTHVVLSGSDSLPAGGEPSTRTRSLLIVGALAPHKNLPVALAVFERVAQRVLDVRLVLAGVDWRGYRRIVEQEIARLGLEGRVDVLGAVPESTVRLLYSQSLALLHLSTCESFGLPLVEAMRSGLPVVAADRGPSPEIAAGAAELVDLADVDRAAADIAALLDSSARLDELRRRGWERARELTWARTAAGVALAVRAAAPV